MADVAFRQTILTCIRQLRPKNCWGGNSIWSSHRSLATAAQVQEEPSANPPWQRHPIPLEPVPPAKHPRLDRLRNEPEPRSFSSFLTDNYARQHNYLRISVTERCNLRCLYCMPEEGIELSPSDRLLTTPEIVYLSSVFVDQGVDKIRLTGGEPTVRKDIVSLMQQIGQLRSRGLKELCITTNGISLHRKLDSMVESGLTAVNLSLDTLDPYQFTLMTRRNGHEAVMKSIKRILEMKKLGADMKLKINCVVMRGLNEREILPFVEMGRDQDVEVRFIEYMPFDGNKWSEKKMITYQEMLAIIRENYPDVHKVQDHPNDTSKTYKVPDFVGRFGFITSMTDNFCGTCNRLRITSDGNLKVCLFGNNEVSLRDIVREENDGKPIDAHAMEAIKQLEMDRREALPGSTGVLGVSDREVRLLDIIGMAVKRKKEKHAGIGELENMKNRPMILIARAFPPLTTASCKVCSKHRPLHLLPPSTRLPRTRLFSTGIALPRQPPSPTPLDVPNINTSPSAPPASEPPHVSSHTRPPPPAPSQPSKSPQPLSHLTSTGTAHMISISHKHPTLRSATATTTLHFSAAHTHHALTTSQLQKGDALAVARIAGIQAAKRTADLIPLAHPGLGITAVRVDVDAFPSGPDATGPAAAAATHPTNAFGGAKVTATVDCEGKTGVEMEALTAATVAGLALYDMLKGVDKGLCLGPGRVVRKTGGKSGAWRWDEGAQRVVKDDEGGAFGSV